MFINGELIKKSENEFIVPKGQRAELTLDIASISSKIQFHILDGAYLFLRTRITGSSSFACDCFLEGEGAKVDCITVVLAENSDVVKTRSNVHHLVSSTHSRLLSKGVAYGHSQIDFLAFAGIQSAAAKSTSKVDLKALIMDEDAKIRADPVLEILNNDVSCTHSASVTEISPKKLFYIQSRGLSEETSRRMVVDGFLAGGVCFGF